MHRSWLLDFWPKSKDRFLSGLNKNGTVFNKAKSNNLFKAVLRATCWTGMKTVSELLGQIIYFFLILSSTVL
jgi:hypothetical protein